MKPFLTVCRQGARFCAAGLLALAHWTLWLGLAVLLGLQGYILAARELTVPGFLLRELTARLAASGLKAEFGRAQFDPLGRILLENVRVSTVTLDEPLMIARTAYLRLNPWDLLLRELEVTEARLTGVDLLLPAMLSPDGVRQTLVRDLHAAVRFADQRRRLEVLELDARIGRLEVTAQGAIALKPDAGGRIVVADFGPRYLRLARAAAPLLPRIETLEAPRLSLVLHPDPDRVAQVTAGFTAARAALPAGPAGLRDGLTVAALEARTAFPLSGREPHGTVLDLAGAALDAGALGRARGFRLRLAGVLSRDPPGFAPEALELAAGSVAALDFAADAVSVRLTPAPESAVTFDAGARLAGEAWALAGTVDPRAGAGVVRFDGRVPRPLLERVGQRTGAGARAVAQLAYAEPPRVRAEARLGPGWRPLAAEGTVDAGAVTARTVPLAGAHADFAWDGARVRVTDIVLRTDRSVALGTYEMDTATRAFRFLLSGELQPADIDGWFRDWWARFWGEFDFPAPPRADVDVSGRWGAPLLTSVFVQAESGPAGLRGVALDGLRTRIFVRPGYVDVLEFQAAQGPHTARGRFSRSAEPGTNRLRELTFDVESGLPAGDAARLVGDGVVQAVAPFRLEQAPAVHAAGRIDGPAAPDGEHRRIALTARAGGAVGFYDFPLGDLAFSGRIDDDAIELDQVSAAFAGGRLNGRAKLEDLAGARRLGFDAVLTGAELGRAIQTVEDYSARRAERPPPPQSRFQQKIAPGRLDLALTAEGTANDLYSFQGTGNAQISGAELGEINLLGILSTLLRRTLLNYSTLQLDAARANFALQGYRLDFSEVKLTGPRAALDAKGAYRLDTRDVDFTTKVYPFEESRGLIGSAVDAVLSPLSQVLEVRLTGKLEQPSWAFVLGPTNLLRSLLGSEEKPPPEPEPVSPPPAEPPP